MGSALYPSCQRSRVERKLRAGVWRGRKVKGGIRVSAVDKTCYRSSRACWKVGSEGCLGIQSTRRGEDGKVGVKARKGENRAALGLRATVF